MKSHDQIQLKKFLKFREKYGDFIRVDNLQRNLHVKLRGKWKVV